jgi:chromosome segregation ATPase
MNNKELHKDYARLKAEVEELTGLLKASTYYNSSEEVTRLKAEVERLTAFNTRTIIPNEELEAQVERLTKAGDAMLSEWASGEEKDAKNFLNALVIWNAAKEGNGQP